MQQLLAYVASRRLMQGTSEVTPFLIMACVVLGLFIAIYALMVNPSEPTASLIGIPP
jgi:hypothetical protein